MSCNGGSKEQEAQPSFELSLPRVSSGLACSPGDASREAGGPWLGRPVAEQSPSTSPGCQLAFSIPLLMAGVTLLLFVLAVARGWLGPGAGVGTGFGEASRPGWIKQPTNTYSSLGFVLVGLWIGWRLRRGTWSHNANPFTQSPFIAAFFPSLVVCVGPGSMAMHATETYLGGRLDMLGMYLVAAFLTAYGAGRFFRLGWVGFSLLFGAVVMLGVCLEDRRWFTPWVGNPGDFIFGFFVLVGALFEALNALVARREHQLAWCALSLGVLLLAFGIWKLARHSGPSHSLFQGHALWHLLCAVAAYCVFRYYVSERPRPRQLQPVALQEGRWRQRRFSQCFQWERDR